MSNRLKVLVALSAPADAQGIFEALNSHGYEAHSASDAVSTLSLAMKKRPDALVLGHKLPGGGGALTLRRLRASAHTAATPVIAIADGGAVSGDEMLSAGAQESLEHPLDPVAVLQALGRHVDSPPVVRSPPSSIIEDDRRLDAIQETGILSGSATESLDRLSRLAANILGAPVALVSIVESDRQVFPGLHGLGGSYGKERQTPLSHSFCQWVVSSAESLAVEDARAHPVLRHSLAIRDLGVIAYAGVPLSCGSDRPIGSFCAIDDRPHAWTEEELDALRDVAKIVEAYASMHQHPALDFSDERGDRVKLEEFCRSMEAARRGASGATRLIERCGPRLEEKTRTELHRITEELLASLERQIAQLTRAAERQGDSFTTGSNS